MLGHRRPDCRDVIHHLLIMTNHVRCIIFAPERCAYQTVHSRGSAFLGALSISSPGHTTRGYQPVLPYGPREIFLGHLVAWCAWEPDATQPISYMRDRRTVKMAYRDLFIFCIDFGFGGVGRRLGDHPPGGLWHCGVNIWYLRRHQGRWACLCVPMLVFTRTGCLIRSEPL